MHESKSSPGFTPLHADEDGALIGYRNDAQATELYDEAMQRQQAALSLLCAFSSSPALSELSHESLCGCIQAIRLLCVDSTGLYSAALEKMQESDMCD